ncbi:phosphopantothenoylcysteine decarboxylase / phosphopantothenate--cysteine ligase [Loktanella fryxellensis]|uniref:Coenzyme A biosynthesis bifunctional protein CoaBC n=1 Tax=Loktanella fryxellensis TaxID=245187 RepID=A0A1H8D9U0_9RHOB|nr:bifunctional phosphopantothenoylcysteine decarboxylase/phosphopantothenate--cysteine ligase CoaBC [Loktanella fryxellensis]SEN03257.1 phosphopantothenoylcysteine decarboxylase / phosphopantothenate--cysteine ligase [Loktanella fryxellensis]
MLHDKRILLIIGGGIAAYKALELIRLLRGAGAVVTPVMTRAAGEFVTPLSVAALAGETVHGALFDLTAEAEMGHIQLSRVADLIVVAPATAHLMARAAAGLSDDLATTLLLATDTPVLIAPAMNVRMWDHPATQRNLAVLMADGVAFVGPDVGDMACGEHGPGRLAEPAAILAAIVQRLSPGPLRGRHVIVTSGPTHEPIDPVRYIANRSSGAQGTAIGRALVAAGATVTFVTGPAVVPPPADTTLVRVETAQAMHDAVMAALPADAVVCAAAVADWRVANAGAQKMKKSVDGLPVLTFAENPDILAAVSRLGDGRPALVVGFAAETQDVTRLATQKRARKGCDWIVANDVSAGTCIMGGTENAVTLVTDAGAEDWPRMGKDAVAERLVARMVDVLTAVTP